MHAQMVDTGHLALLLCVGRGLQSFVYKNSLSSKLTKYRDHFPKIIPTSADLTSQLYNLETMANIDYSIQS